MGVRPYIPYSRKGPFPCHIDQPETRSRKLSNFLYETRIIKTSKTKRALANCRPNSLIKADITVLTL